MNYLENNIHTYNGIDMNFFNIASAFIYENKDLIKEAVNIVTLGNLSELQVEEAVMNAQLRFIHYPSRDFVEGGNTCYTSCRQRYNNTLHRRRSRISDIMERKMD